MPAATATYDTIGVGYDGTRRPDPELAQRLRALLQPRRGGRYLDVACGTGNYTHLLAEAGLDMTGIDVSERMLAEARAKSAAVEWRLGDVMALPFDDAAFDGAVCTNAVHHFPALAPAFREVRRVLRGGRFVIFSSTPEQMRDYWLNAYFPVTMRRSMDALPSLDSIVHALGQAGFRVTALAPYFVSPQLQDWFLYSGKYRPLIYLDPAVRRGISAFALHGDDREVQRGCAALMADVDSGAFARVAEQFHGAAGDYMFIVAEPARPGASA